MGEPGDGGVGRRETGNVTAFLKEVKEVVDFSKLVDST
jgi:hypothetical protein